MWYRAHTFGPAHPRRARRSTFGRRGGANRAARLRRGGLCLYWTSRLYGDVLYRDLTENKPPLGYWLYTLAVALGGYNELAIRVMPIPFVLATIAMVWWIAHRLGGPGSAWLAASLFIVLSTDPYLFGNGANLEHFINLFAVASLVLLILGWDRAEPWPLLGSGLCLGAAALVKQVAIVSALIFVPALLLRAWSQEDRLQKRAVRVFLTCSRLVWGSSRSWRLAATILIARGAGRSAYEDIFQYGRALATDTLAEPNAPAGPLRWITGNADPSGRLPWPFGATDYLVWWGSGSWPLWLVSIAAVVYLSVSARVDGSAAPGRGLDDRGVGPGDSAGALLATLLSLANRRRGDRRGGLLERRDVGADSSIRRRHAIILPEDHQSGSPESARNRARGEFCSAVDGRDRSDIFPSGSRLPARASGGADDPIQRRKAVGRAAGDGTRARPPRHDLASASPVRLGLAEPAAFLWADGQPDASFLCGQLTTGPSRSGPWADPAAEPKRSWPPCGAGRRS